MDSLQRLKDAVNIYNYFTLLMGKLAKFKNERFSDC